MNSVPVWLRAIHAYCRHWPLDRGKTRLVEFVFRRMPIPDVEVTSRLSTGSSIRLRLPIWVDFTIYCIGLYEHYLARYFLRLLQKDAVFLDVGSYIGQYALLAAYAAPRGRTLAFEPVPDSARRLRVALGENAIVNCEVIEAAAGARCGTTTMYLSRDMFSSSVSESHAHTTQAITVPLVTIDSLVKQRDLTRVDAMKVDVEESEDAVIAGAMVTLTRFRPLVLLEVGRPTSVQQATPALDFLASLGYTFYRMNHGRLDAIVGRIEAAENVIALPPGHALPPR